MARTPLYKAAETEMIRRIEAGEWEVGRRLPNEFILADEFKVSQGTMRRALMTLEAQGLLSRKPGRGTIVARVETTMPNGATPPAPAPAATLTAGGAPVAFDVHRAKSSLRGADADEAALFGTGRLSTLERLLKRGGTRTGIEEITIPEALAPALDETAPVALDAFLDAHGLAAAEITESVGADITSVTDSVSLACDRYTALLVLTRTARDGKGRVVARQVMRLIGRGLSYG
jgi:GntR family transcriptional regulator